MVKKPKQPAQCGLSARDGLRALMMAGQKGKTMTKTDLLILVNIALLYLRDGETREARRILEDIKRTTERENPRRGKEATP